MSYTRFQAKQQAKIYKLEKALKLQREYLQNKDAVIKGLCKMITHLQKFERWYESADSKPVLEKLDEAQARVEALERAGV